MKTHEPVTPSASADVWFFSLVVNALEKGTEEVMGSGWVSVCGAQGS